MFDSLYAHSVYLLHSYFETRQWRKGKNLTKGLTHYVRRYTAGSLLICNLEWNIYCMEIFQRKNIPCCDKLWFLKFWSTLCVMWDINHLCFYTLLVRTTLEYQIIKQNVACKYLQAFQKFTTFKLPQTILQQMLGWNSKCL